MRFSHVVWGLLGALLLAGCWLATRDLEARLATEVTELLPADARDPTVRIVRTLATSDSRTVLIVSDGLKSAAERRAVADAITSVLEASPVVDFVWRADAPDMPEDLVETWSASSVGWFWPEWWDALGRPDSASDIARKAVEDLVAFLERPESAFWEDALTEDLFLLVPRNLAALSELLPATTRERAEEGKGTLRFMVQLRDSPLARDVQQSVFALLEDVRNAVLSTVPGAQVRDAGVHRFAAASERAIRGEIGRLNLLVAATVAALCLLFLRRWSILALLALVAGVTVAGGLVAALSVFGRIHILTLVVGSILVGVAVDYGVHVFLEIDAASPRERLRKVARPLLVGSLSTIGGFLMLVWTDLPLLRQLGVFIAGGLSVALGASLLLAATAPVMTHSLRILPRLRMRAPGRVVWIAFGILSPLLAGLFRVAWSDDIRELDYPLPEVRAEDAAVRALFGEESESQFLVLGQDWATVVKNIHRLKAPGVTSPGFWLSDPEVWRAALAVAREQPIAAAIEAELAAAGFVPEAFEPFFAQWAEWTSLPWSELRYEATVAAQLDALPGPAALMAGSADSMNWLLVRAPEGFEAPEEIQMVPLKQLDSLNAAFAQYRNEALNVAAVGLLILGCGLLIGFGPRHGIVPFLLPVLPAVLVLGALGLRGDALNLFHLLGAFLAICLTVDYVVFALQARRWGYPLPFSISLAALTTAGSFGWLATSAIPAVAALGTVVAPTVLLAWLLALGLTGARRDSEMRTK